LIATSLLEFFLSEQRALENCKRMRHVERKERALAGSMMFLGFGLIKPAAR
jgi:hypothetical protein